ncbi:hypothetical protein DICPUDRAFT_77363 [Dictyostelium purpureum]|uniref:Uncharacterized protein n=1 Tax=Dictyostelium purpureum TaxID=5786 RepID=F0ZGE1_DICPU|nr:uncharacterized protein DICPUDRAFT_77363 [Dictyostelium purpureum]EGC36994.1 hypothetical protein DICPUDRAFT_77363 [Dictyostelium purpureum]|eukprot:XP_003286491.1 hypothetical protein DICPUDRAFT_77363 [Dictyostelium purpureum]
MDSFYIYTENEDKKSIKPLSFILDSSFPGFFRYIIKSQTNYYEKGSKDNRYSNFDYPLHNVSTDDPKGCGYEIPPVKSDVIYVYNNYNYTSSTSYTSLNNTSIFQYDNKSCFNNAIMNGYKNSDDDINFNYCYNHYPIQVETPVPTSMVSPTPMVSSAPMETSAPMVASTTFTTPPSMVTSLILPAIPDYPAIPSIPTIYLCNACAKAESIRIKSENEAASKSKL